MTPLDQLKSAKTSATAGPWQVWRNRNGRYCIGPSVNYTVAEMFHTSMEGWGANAALIVAAVNALPDLLAVCEAAQRHTAAVYRKATCDAAGAFDASVEFEDSYNALTAALAQWEKQ